MINKLLERQIAKYISPHMAENQALQDFIKAINNSYNSFERDLELLRHAFEMNEQEYEAVNKSLIYQSELKQKSINNLLSTIKKMHPNYEFSTKDNVDDLLAISEFLSTQISERKAAEEKYKSIVENATDIIYKVNQKGYFTFVNQVAERITGFTTAQLLNTRFTDLVVPDYQQKVTDFLK